MGYRYTVIPEEVSSVQIARDFVVEDIGDRVSGGYGIRPEVQRVHVDEPPKPAFQFLIDELSTANRATP